MEQIPATSVESDAFSKNRKRRRFTFVGSTVVYAHMQAAGMINDHLVDCFRYRQLRQNWKTGRLDFPRNESVEMALKRDEFVIF